MKGINLPEFWRQILHKYYGDDRKAFDNEFSKVDMDYKYEEELLGVSPKDYEIINIDEIEERLKNKRYC